MGWVLVSIIIVISVVMDIQKQNKKDAAKKGTVNKSSKMPKLNVLHNEAEHTHDRLSEDRIQSESPDEHYRHQIETFRKAGLIGMKEAQVLWENYENSKN